MERKWYYQLMGEIVGPLSVEELRQHAADGQIERDTLIRKGSQGAWVLADKVGGLLGTQTRTHSSDGLSNLSERSASSEVSSRGKALTRAEPLVPDRPLIAVSQQAGTTGRVKVGLLTAALLACVGVGCAYWFLKAPHMSEEQQALDSFKTVCERVEERLTKFREEENEPFDVKSLEGDGRNIGTVSRLWTFDSSVPVAHDVQKTTSLVSPYSATLMFGIIYTSQHHFTQFTGRNGDNTADAVNASNTPKVSERKWLYTYAYQQKRWILKAKQVSTAYSGYKFLEGNDKPVGDDKLDQLMRVE